MVLGGPDLQTRDERDRRIPIRRKNLDGRLKAYDRVTSNAGLSESKTLGEDPETRSTCQNPWRRIGTESDVYEPPPGGVMNGCVREAHL